MAISIFDDKQIDLDLNAPTLSFTTNPTGVGSTGVGEGVAIPHAKVHGLTKTIVLFFRLKTSVDFSAPDEKKVDLILVILLVQLI